MPTNAEFDLVRCAKLAWLGVSQQVQVAERLAGASFFSQFRWAQRSVLLFILHPSFVTFVGHMDEPSARS